MDVLGWSGLSNAEETMLAREVIDLPTLVVDKRSYGPFLGTDLEDTLHQLGVRDVLVCGIDTDICVLATAVDLFDRGFRPLVISDLSMSHAGPELHDAALRILPRFIGEEGIVTVAELTARELATR